MHQRNKGSAFTLVELLVVIGIISVLISILLPALARARAMAQSVKCLSQVRQVQLALSLYANDYSSVIPAPTFNASGDVWFRLLQGQRSDGSVEYIKYPGTAAQRELGFGINPILSCPSASLRTPGTYGLYSPGDDGTRFPFEPSFMRIKSTIPGVVDFQGWKLSRIKRPADFGLVGCTSICNVSAGSNEPATGYFSWTSYKGFASLAGQYAGLWEAHLNRVSLSFADGHAESCDGDRLLSLSNYNGNTTPTFPSTRKTGASWYKLQNFTIVAR